MATPLDIKQFFGGKWHGSGFLTPSWCIRWLFPKEAVEFDCETVWFSDSVWQVRDHFSFASGFVMERKMFCELTAPDRIHATADDLPLGADILLAESSFTFTPYRVLARYKRIFVQLRCTDVSVVGSDSVIHDHIQMRWMGLKVADMTIDICRT